MTCPARIVTERATLALQTAIQSTTVTLADRDKILEVLRSQHVLDAEVLEEKPPYFFAGEISNMTLDSYDTRMDPETTLKNYVEDAIRGVAFCDSHNHNELSFGRTFAATMLEDTEDRSVISAFYTLPGIKTNRVTTDDLIFSIRSGLTKDLSVGFKPGAGFMYRCSICARDLWDWDCPHIPGVIYEVTPDDDPDSEPVKRYAFAWIVGARLSEVSAAYDGATEKCMILKATREAESGRIPARIVQLVESRCRIHLPGKRVQAPGYNSDTKETKPMTDEEKEQQKKAARAALDELLGRVRTALGPVRGLVVAIKPDEIEDVDGIVKTINTLGAEVVRLTPLAADGDVLKKELIDETIAEGVRAFGKEFVEDKQRSTLEKLAIDDIKNLRAQYALTAKSKLGEGGRKSSEEGGEDPEAEKAKSATASATEDSFSEEYFVGV